MNSRAVRLRLEVATSNQATHRMGTSLRKKAKLVGIVLAVCMAIGLLEASQVYFMSARWGRPLSWTRSAGTTMPSWFVLAALVPFVIAVAKRFPIETLRRPHAIAIHFAAAIVFSVVSLVVGSWLSDFVFYDGVSQFTFMTNLWRLLATYFTMNMAQYWSVVGIYYAFVYNKRF